MKLTKQQIEYFVNKVGQPEASILLNKFFNSYRHYLNSSDVADLYDDNYAAKINSLETYLIINNKYKIHTYNKYSYEYLIPRLTIHSRILDVGCGSGDFALAIAAQGVKYVVGVDFSRKAIKEANAKLAKSGLNMCHFLCADVLNMDNQFIFDFVILNDIIEHLSDAELKTLFKNISSVLVTGGEVIIHTPNGLAICNDTDTNFFQKAAKTYLRLFKHWRGFERTVEQIYYDQTHINIKSFRQLRKCLKEYGYQASVIYDEKSKLPFINQLSSNMLVIAKKIIND